MTREERQSCICTINTLRRLALNIHGVIDVVDDANYDKLIELLNGGADGTVDQLKTKVGKWIRQKSCSGYTHSYECSECGRTIYAEDDDLTDFPYCHCGAEMQEVE